MALIDRLFHDPGVESISHHTWSAAMWFLSKGEITRAQVVSAFTLSSTDEVQLDQLIAHYTSLSVPEKAEFHSCLEAAGALAEADLITKAVYKGFLGLS